MPDAMMVQQKEAMHNGICFCLQSSMRKTCSRAANLNHRKEQKGMVLLGTPLHKIAKKHQSIFLMYGSGESRKGKQRAKLEVVTGKLQKLLTAKKQAI